MNTETSSTRKGVILAIMAYSSWGLFPVYWKLLKSVPGTDILGHRIIWSTVFFLGLLAARDIRAVGRSLKGAARVWRSLVLSAALIASNWFIYIYAVNSGRVLESSLGYFINPLVNVGLGYLILGERLRPLQWPSVGLAAIGVLQLAFQGDSFPFLALFLAFTFGFYGLVRKRMSFDPLAASTVESLGLAVPSMIFLLAETYFAGTESPASGAGFAYSTGVMALLILGGVVTGFPLLCFTEAGKRLPLSVMGFFQYLSPSLQFSLAVFIYHERFTDVHARSFLCIWVALVVYSFDLMKALNRGRLLQPSA